MKWYGNDKARFIDSITNVHRILLYTKNVSVYNIGY